MGLAGGVNLYAYVDNNPLALMDPRGESIFSKALGKLGRQALKKHIRETIETTLEKHLKHLSKKPRKELLDDVQEIYDILDSFNDFSVWDLVEWIPVVGDGASACKLGYDFYRIEKKLNDLSRKVLKKRRAAFDAAKNIYWSKHSPTGKAPTRKVKVRYKDGTERDITEIKELHHNTPIRDGGGDEDSNLLEVWPGEHCEVDPCRNIGYTVLEVLK